MGNKVSIIPSCSFLSHHKNFAHKIKNSATEKIRGRDEKEKLQEKFQDVELRQQARQANRSISFKLELKNNKRLFENQLPVKIRLLSQLTCKKSQILTCTREESENR